ncbi:MAG: riboflavin synthase [Candidatus Aegiribacteria sp.]|nr:riboflavin synthase [Candidatus Aegiribacteria sp.]MBD3295178.1 riboflavin synthase [Candidatus Fermentibacteria bacterium]
MSDSGIFLSNAPVRISLRRVRLFTGLIEQTGEVAAFSGGNLLIKTAMCDEAEEGDSIAVDGSCLTVSRIREGVLQFQCSRETVSRTIAGTYVRGARVNLERPLRLIDELHGHLVSGHIDETASVVKVEKGGEEATFWFSFSKSRADLMVEKGSIAVNGISLTVASVLPGRFSAVLIPETMSRTTAKEWKPGTPVNLEYDLIGKYVKKQMEAAIGRRKLRDFIES